MLARSALEDARSCMPVEESTCFIRPLNISRSWRPGSPCSSTSVTKSVLWMVRAAGPRRRVPRSGLDRTRVRRRGAIEATRRDATRRDARLERRGRLEDLREVGEAEDGDDAEEEGRDLALARAAVLELLGDDLRRADVDEGPRREGDEGAVERAAEHDAGRVAADLAARLRSVRGEIRVGVLFNTLEERTAADSVDRPNVTPSVQSIKLPAWIMIVLSMRPKPTMGTAQTRKWRESSRRGGAAADDACREAATRAGEALPRVRSRRTRAAARPRRQAARRRISEQWQRNTSCDLTRSAVPTYGTHSTYGTVCTAERTCTA